MSGESLERRGKSFRKTAIAFWRMVFKCLVNRSLESRSRPRYLTVGDQGMGRCWMIRGCGRGGRRFVKRMSSVFVKLTWSFHLWKYRRSLDIVEDSLREIVSGRQDWARMAISSANKARWMFGAITFALYHAHLVSLAIRGSPRPIRD